MKRRKALLFLTVAFVGLVSMGLLGCTSANNLEKAKNIDAIFNNKQVTFALDTVDFDGWKVVNEFKNPDSVNGILFEKNQTQTDGLKTFIEQNYKMYFPETKNVITADGRYDVQTGEGTKINVGALSNFDGFVEYVFYPDGRYDGKAQKSLLTFVEKTVTSDSASVKTAEIFDCKGNSVLTLTEEEMADFAVQTYGKGDFVLLGKKMYRSAFDGELVPYNSYNPLIGIPENIIYAGGYSFIEIEGNTVYLLDTDFSVKDSYQVPSVALDYFIGVLADGSVLVQYYVAQNAESGDFDFYDKINSTKCKLHTQKITLPDFKIKNIGVNYLIGYLENEYNNQSFSDDYSNQVINLLGIVPIIDKRVNTADEAYVNADSNLKLKYSFSNFVANQSGFPNKVIDDEFVVLDEFGTYYLLDKNGKEISRYNEPLNYNGKFFTDRRNTVIYDKEFEKEFILSENGIQNMVGILDGFYLLKGTDQKYYVYNGQKLAVDGVLYNDGIMTYVSDYAFIMQTETGFNLVNGDAEVVQSFASQGFDAVINQDFCKITYVDGYVKTMILDKRLNVIFECDGKVDYYSGRTESLGLYDIDDNLMKTCVNYIFAYQKDGINKYLSYGRA